MNFASLWLLPLFSFPVLYVGYHFFYRCFLITRCSRWAKTSSTLSDLTMTNSMMGKSKSGKSLHIVSRDQICTALTVRWWVEFTELTERLFSSNDCNNECYLTDLMYWRTGNKVMDKNESYRVFCLWRLHSSFTTDLMEVGDKNMGVGRLTFVGKMVSNSGDRCRFPF